MVCGISEYCAWRWKFAGKQAMATFHILPCLALTLPLASHGHPLITKDQPVGPSSVSSAAAVFAYQ